MGERGGRREIMVREREREMRNTERTLERETERETVGVREKVTARVSVCLQAICLTHQVRATKI